MCSGDTKGVRMKKRKVHEDASANEVWHIYERSDLTTILFVYYSTSTAKVLYLNRKERTRTITNCTGFSPNAKGRGYCKLLRMARVSNGRAERIR